MFNPYSALVLATIIWGSSGVFIKYLNLPPTTLAFFRLFLPAIILYLYFRAKKINLFRDNVKLILFGSSMSAVFMILYFLSYTNTSIANALITLYTWPIFATIFSAVLLNEKVPRRNIFLLIVSFIGVIFIYMGKSISLADKDFLGITVMLAAAIIYALMVIIFKKLGKTHSNYEIIFYQSFVGAILFFPFLFAVEPLPSIVQSIVAVIYAIINGLLGFGLFYFALRHIKASTVSSISYLEVVSGILFGVILVHETLTLNIIIGGILITGSTLLIKI